MVVVWCFFTGLNHPQIFYEWYSNILVYLFYFLFTIYYIFYI